MTFEGQAFQLLMQLKRDILRSNPINEDVLRLREEIDQVQEALERGLKGAASAEALRFFYHQAARLIGLGQIALSTEAKESWEAFTQLIHSPQVHYRTQPFAFPFFFQRLTKSYKEKGLEKQDS